jgi:uroporphyrin-3 C-methyltransferase
VDQNAVMQKLSQLANTVDELPVLDVNFGDDQNATKLSDSLSDWAENAEKSATSFLNHFIRISPKHGADRPITTARCGSQRIISTKPRYLLA